MNREELLSIWEKEVLSNRNSEQCIYNGESEIACLSYLANKVHSNYPEGFSCKDCARNISFSKIGYSLSTEHKEDFIKKRLEKQILKIKENENGIYRRTNESSKREKL